jgi:hypothetical protein
MDDAILIRLWRRCAFPEVAPEADVLRSHSEEGVGCFSQKMRRVRSSQPTYEGHSKSNETWLNK